MIFGKTNEERDSDRQRRIIALIRGELVFVWWPVKLENGRWLWLEKCYRKAEGVRLKGGKYRLHAIDRRHYSLSQTLLTLVKPEPHFMSFFSRRRMP